MMPEFFRLLNDTDPAPVIVHNEGAASPFLILCDHAGRATPAKLGDLGVSSSDWERHIAWDIGAAGVARRLGAALGAVTIEQVYSRLVIDCNRRPGHPTSIPPVSDGTDVPANEGLSGEQTAARVREIFAPYHDRIAAEQDRRLQAGQDSVVIAVHSFTPVFGGASREWQAGVLHDRNPGFAIATGALLRACGLHVGENEPYRLSDDSDYTVPVHAEARSLHYVELEIRQDLIEHEAGQAEWAALLADVLPAALREQ